MKNDLSLNIWAVVRSPEVKNALVSAVDPKNGTKLEVQIGELKSTGLPFKAGEQPDVLLFDIDMADSEELEALERIRREDVNGHTAVIATAENASTDAMRRLLRGGVDDFLPQPLSGSEVSETLQAITRKLRAGERSGADSARIFTFLRASGGVGATTLAVHTACALSQRKRKEPPRKVCLIDLDLQFGTAGLYLDVDNAPGLVEIAHAPERLDAELLQGVMTPCNSGFDVLTAPATPMPLDALRPEVVGQLIDVARRTYDDVVIDLPHALSHWTDAVLARSSVLAVVTHLTVPAIRQSRRLLDLLQEEGHFMLPLALILNRHQPRWGDGLSVRQAEKALGRKFDQIVPEDQNLVTDALNQGVPVFDIKRRSRFAKAVRAMATTCFTHIAATNQDASEPTRART